MTRKFVALVAFLALVQSPFGLALTIGPAPETDVGLLDIFIYASTKNELPNSNPATEESWVESILGFDVSYAKHGNNVPITPTNEDPTAFAWLLPDLESDYFVVKNAAFWALFQNVGNLAYAVVDADSGYLPEKMNFGNATISHYGVVNGRNPPCEGPDCDPEPPCEGPDCDPEPPCEGPDCNPPNPPNDIPVPAPVSLMALALLFLGRRLRRA